MKLILDQQNIPIKEAKDFKSRLYGLMGKKNIDYGLYFTNCNAIHTFFMRENIDVIGLNENNEVIFMENNVSKNKIIKIHHPIKKTSILELPKNTSLSLHFGDVLLFEFEDEI